jgi:hypothetical protein
MPRRVVLLLALVILILVVILIVILVDLVFCVSFAQIHFISRQFPMRVPNTDPLN